MNKINQLKTELGSRKEELESLNNDLEIRTKIIEEIGNQFSENQFTLMSEGELLSSSKMKNSQAISLHEMTGEPNLAEEEAYSKLKTAVDKIVNRSKDIK